MLLMEKSPQVTVSISKQVSDQLDNYCHRKAVVKKLIVTRVIGWFLRQPGPIQDAVISVDGEHTEQELKALEYIVEMAMARNAKPHGFRVAASDNIPDDPPAGKQPRKR